MAVTGQGKRQLSGAVCFILIFIHTSKSLNLGLIAGDLKKAGSPLVIRKISHHSPVFINVNPGISKLANRPTLPPLQRLQTKPPPSLPSLRSTRSPLLPVIPPPILPPLIIPPLFPPLLPHIPLIPPILPPVLPIIPVPSLKAPLLPLFPPKPLKIPILGRTPLERVFDNIKLPRPCKPLKKTILRNLMDLRIKGSLTSPEFHRFKKKLNLK